MKGTGAGGKFQELIPSLNLTHLGITGKYSGETPDSNFSVKNNPEGSKPMYNSLEEVLRTETGVHVFRSFLSKKFVEEHVDAFVMINDILKEPEAARKSMMNEFYSSYIKQGAPNELNNTHPILMDTAEYMKDMEGEISEDTLKTYEKQLVAMMEDDFFSEFQGSEFLARLQRMNERSDVNVSLVRSESYNTKLSRLHNRKLKRVHTKTLPESDVAAIVLKDLNNILMDPSGNGPQALRAYLHSFDAGRYVDLYKIASEYLAETSIIEKSNLINNIYNKFLKKSAPKPVKLPFELISLSSTEEETNNEFFRKVKEFCFNTIRDSYYDGFTVSKSGRNLAKDYMEMEKEEGPKSKTLSSFDDVRNNKDGLDYLRKYLVSYSTSENLDFVMKIESGYRKGTPETRNMIKYDIMENFIKANNINISKKVAEDIRTRIDDESFDEILFEDAYREVYKFLSGKVFHYFTMSRQGKELSGLFKKKRTTGRSSLGLDWNSAEFQDPSAFVESTEAVEVPMEENDIRKNINDVEQILESGVEKAVDALRSYMESQHKVESLEFYFAIRGYQNASLKDKEALKYELFRKFLQSKAKKEINVSASTKSRIMHDISTTTEGLYNVCLKEITQLIQKDTFTKFMTTEYGKQAAAHIMKARKKKQYKKRTISSTRVNFILGNIRNVLSVEEGAKAFEKFLVGVKSDAILNFLVEAGTLLASRENEIEKKVYVIKKYIKPETQAALTIYSTIVKKAVVNSINELLFETLKELLIDLEREFFNLFCFSETGKHLAADWSFYRSEQSRKYGAILNLISEGLVELDDKERYLPNPDSILSSTVGVRALQKYFEEINKSDSIEIFIDMKKLYDVRRDKQSSIFEKEQLTAFMWNKYFSRQSTFSGITSDIRAKNKDEMFDSVYEKYKREIGNYWDSFLQSSYAIRLIKKCKWDDSLRIVAALTDTPNSHKISVLGYKDISLKRLFNVCSFVFMASISDKKMSEFAAKFLGKSKSFFTGMSKFDILVALCMHNLQWKNVESFPTVSSVLTSKMKRPDLSELWNFYIMSYGKVELMKQTGTVGEYRDENVTSVSESALKNLKSKYSRVMKEIERDMDEKYKTSIIALFTGLSIPAARQLNGTLLSSLEENGLSYVNPVALRDLFVHLISHLNLTKEAIVLSKYIKALKDLLAGVPDVAGAAVLGGVAAKRDQTTNDGSVEESDSTSVSSYLSSTSQSSAGDSPKNAEVTGVIVDTTEVMDVTVVPKDAKEEIGDDTKEDQLKPKADSDKMIPKDLDAASEKPEESKVDSIEMKPMEQQEAIEKSNEARTPRRRKYGQKEAKNMSDRVGENIAEHDNIPQSMEGSKNEKEKDSISAKPESRNGQSIKTTDGSSIEPENVPVYSDMKKIDSVVTDMTELKNLYKKELKALLKFKKTLEVEFEDLLASYEDSSSESDE